MEFVTKKYPELKKKKEEVAVDSETSLEEIVDNTTIEVAEETSELVNNNDVVEVTEVNTKVDETTVTVDDEETK